MARQQGIPGAASILSSLITPHVPRALQPSLARAGRRMSDVEVGEAIARDRERFIQEAHRPVAA